MMMFPIKTLQQRFVVYMLLPVALLLSIMGAIGFFYARNIMIQQWEEASALKLQRAAHHVDMRLARPKEWIKLYLYFVEGHHYSMQRRQEVLEELERTDGVVSVRIKSLSAKDQKNPAGPITNSNKQFAPDRSKGMAIMQRHMMADERFQVTMPRFDSDTSNRTVSIISQAVSDNSDKALELEVVMDFAFLLKDIPYTGWWQSRNAFLIDAAGNVLVSTSSQAREKLGNNGDSLEAATLDAMRDNSSGTVRGDGNPPREVSGYHSLAEAPWYLVVFAPGEEILRPILRFRNYYLLTLGGFVLIILLLIRRVTGQVARSVNQLSAAAGDIARGEFDLTLPDLTGGEIGALTRSFNTMAAQLKERIHLRQSLDLAKEVQQNLLPAKAPDFPGLDVAGRSIYCEETGGDYFDYLPAGRTLRLVIGDVAGHGISSALLMSSVRATLRQRYDTDDDIGAVISYVNRHVVMDVGDSGRFMTLLVMAIDTGRKKMQWVRAGHDPGMLYRSSDGLFEDLDGPDMALGIDPDWTYTVQTTDWLQAGDIIFLGTDGIWETFNCDRAMFGKEAVKRVIFEHRDESADTILDAVFDAVAEFACETKIADDMTLIVVKAFPDRLPSSNI